MKMLVSKCHNESVNVVTLNDGESWYECDKCGRPCQTKLSFWIDENEDLKDASI